MGQIIAVQKSQIEPPKKVETTSPKKVNDDHYENLESMRLNTVPQSPNRETNSEEEKKPVSIKLPRDTKSKVDPYSARYDTLLMIPDVQWDKNQQQQQTSQSDKSQSSQISKK